VKNTNIEINKSEDNFPDKFTVKELIEILQSFPPDLRVVTHGQRKGYENILNPQIISVFRNEEAMSDYEGEYDRQEIPGQDSIEVVLILRDNRWD
jgi:hypothetical protein